MTKGWSKFSYMSKDVSKSNFGPSGKTYDRELGWE